MLPPFSASVLLRLPRDYLVGVFKDWLSLREMSRLERATSSREGGEKLL